MSVVIIMAVKEEVRQSSIKEEDVANCRSTMKIQYICHCCDAELYSLIHMWR